MQDSGAGAGLYQCTGDENMRKKRIMIIGAGKSGKTTLIRAIEEDGRPVKRTPHMVYGTKTIDVPGPYLESPWMYKHIIAAAQDASCILMLADLTGEREVYSPGFAKVFRVPVLGVLTKETDSRSQEERCIAELKKAGVQPPFYHVVFPEGRGFAKLREKLDEIEEGLRSKQ